MKRGDIIRNKYNRNRFAVVRVPVVYTPRGPRINAEILQDTGTFIRGHLRLENWDLFEEAVQEENRIQEMELDAGAIRNAARELGYIQYTGNTFSNVDTTTTTW